MPAAQGTHAPPAVDVEPKLHQSHELEPDADDLPASQGIGAFTLLGQEEPAGHVTPVPVVSPAQYVPHEQLLIEL